MSMAAIQPTELTAPGPQGDLHGTYLDAGKNAPVVLIVPGSGPTDRDGNSPLGVNAAPYKLIAEGLAGRGISSVRIDKRGMFGSANAVSDANAVTITDYAADVASWISTIRGRVDAPCVWVLGHSEGALVALAAGRKPEGICGLLLVAAPGRRLGDLLRAQLAANPANAPILPQASQAIADLEAGGSVDVSTLPAPLVPLFRKELQGFLRDLFSHDPAAMIADIPMPVLILQGGTDLQTGPEDARRLAAAQPSAELVLLEGVNHVLKQAPAEQGANLATYADPNLPLAAGVVEALAGFVRKNPI